MDDPLEASFEADLRCTPQEAEDLATLARERIPHIVGAAEDSDEDLVLRLSDPRIFGIFVESILGEARMRDATRAALVERAFDLLPLPRGEGDVILVEARAPPRLLHLVAFLMGSDAFSVLHFMHLLYAVFLNRSLISNVPRSTRAAVLSYVLRVSEASEGLRVFYACMHLVSVPASEAHAELRKVLRDRSLPRSVKESVASIVASDDGGVATLARIAREEGLFPAESDDAHSAAVVANIPRMPEALRSLGESWLRRSAET